MGWLPLLAAIAISTAAVTAGASGKSKKTLVGAANLNTASAEQLALLPGVGPTVAARIVAARAEKPFERIWEITRVKGIGSKLFRKLEDRLRIEGASDLRWLEPPKAPKRGSKRQRKGPKIVTFAQPRPQAPFVGPPLSAAGGRTTP